ncbi:MAG: hypothetical protein JF587_18455 [Catenulisporales bacterium]|nr:hypothetical protein [Catenulisporales bacterium]
MPEEDQEDRTREQTDPLEQTMQEPRIVQTGVQILPAFPLSPPFTNRFANVSGFQQVVHLVALVSAAVTTAMVIAPVSYHRRHRGEQAHLWYALPARQGKHTGRD